MKPRQLYIVRHGAIIEVNGKRYIGQTEAPLSEHGVEQAWALRNWLQSHDFTAILCSDLTRSLRTAKIIVGARRLPIHAHPELREINLGEWDGVSFREIEAKYPEEFKARGAELEHWKPPGGESFADCRKRVLEFLHHELPQFEGNVLLVGHAGVNRIILCEALGLPTANLMRIGQDYGCANIVEFGPSRARVHLLNFVPPSSVERPEPAVTKRRRNSAQ